MSSQFCTSLSHPLPLPTKMSLSLLVQFENQVSEKGCTKQEGRRWLTIAVQRKWMVWLLRSGHCLHSVNSTRTEPISWKVLAYSITSDIQSQVLASQLYIIQYPNLHSVLGENCANNIPCKYFIICGGLKKTSHRQRDGNMATWVAATTTLKHYE